MAAATPIADVVETDVPSPIAEMRKRMASVLAQGRDVKNQVGMVVRATTERPKGLQPLLNTVLIDASLCSFLFQNDSFISLLQINAFGTSRMSLVQIREST